MFVKEVDRILRPNSIGNILTVITQKKQSDIIKRKTFGQDIKPDEPIIQKSEEEKPRQEQNPYKVNTCIEHKTYGKGKIVAVNGDDVTIDFGNGLLKSFRLKICLEKGIITLIK